MINADSLVVFFLAFVCEYVDSSLGMGYGTTLAPILLLMGYQPLQIVPLILLSELLSGLSAGFLHHKHGNVDFKPKIIDLTAVTRALSRRDSLTVVKDSVPKHLKVAGLIALCSVLGTVSAVLLAVRLPAFWLRLYIGFIVLSMGVIIVTCSGKTFVFSWKKITALGIIASFNKGLSGGGYGPIVTCGQILSGVEAKSAIGITSLAEAITCGVGVVVYAMCNVIEINTELTLPVILGALCSVPLAVKSVKIISDDRLKRYIALATIILGLAALIKVLI